MEYFIHTRTFVFTFVLEKKPNLKQHWLFWQIVKQVLTNYIYVLEINFFKVNLIIFKTWVTPHSFTHTHYIVLIEHILIYFSMNKQIPIYHCFPFEHRIKKNIILLLSFVKQSCWRLQWTIAMVLDICIDNACVHFKSGCIFIKIS